MLLKKVLIVGSALWIAACSSSSGPEGSLEIAVPTSAVVVPESGSADAQLTLSNSGGEPVAVDLCSSRLAAGLQEQVSGVWVEAGANACGNANRESVVIGPGTSIQTRYAISRPGTYRLRVPFLRSTGDFGEVTSASFQATR